MRLSSSATATSDRNGFDAAHQATDETMARTRDLMQTNLKPATEAFSKASNAAVQFGHGNLRSEWVRRSPPGHRRDYGSDPRPDADQSEAGDRGVFQGEQCGCPVRPRQPQIGMGSTQPTRPPTRLWLGPAT